MRNRRQERQGLSKAQIRGFQRRAREAIKESSYGSLYALVKGRQASDEVPGVPPSGMYKPTVTAWLRKESPRLPFTAALLTFAEKTGVGLDHLLLDDGPEVRGAPGPFRTTAALLHNHVVAVLVHQAKQPAADVRAAFPDPGELLERVMDFCQRELARKQELDREVFRRLVASGVAGKLKRDDPERYKLLRSGVRWPLLPLQEPVIGEGPLPQTGARDVPEGREPNPAPVFNWEYLKAQEAELAGGEAARRAELEARKKRRSSRSRKP